MNRDICKVSSKSLAILELGLEHVFAYANKACCGGVGFLGPRGTKILLRYVSVSCKAVWDPKKNIVAERRDLFVNILSNVSMLCSFT